MTSPIKSLVKSRQAARALLSQRLALEPITTLPEDLIPQTISEGYAIQSALNSFLTHAGMGEQVGHKIGCTTPVMQAFIGIDHPCAGRIFSQTVMHGSARIPHGGFVKVGVECEIAVQLAHDLPAQASAYTRDSVAAAVGAVMAAIELVDERYENYRTLGIPTLIGDDFFNAGCVLGKPVFDWQSLDLAALVGRTTINGVEAGRGTGALVMGHPFNALAWLANSRAEYGQPGLQAGEFILLGSVVETKWLQAGDEVSIEIDQLGSLQLTVDA